jgi:O-antigen/teichoic acid export membrane protein
VLWPWIGGLVNDQLGILIAFSIACLGYCLQFPCRGLLAAARQFRGYATVVVVDSVLRALVAIILLTVGEVSVIPYTLAVGGAALAAGLVGALLVRRSGSAHGGDRVDHFGRDSARLMVAASSMQTLLNSGTLVAKLAAGPGQAALAGRVLAVMTIARLPVLLFQSLQPVYVTRIATRWHHQDRRGVRRLLVVLGVATGCLAITLVIGAATIGPWATSLFFGAAYELDRGSIVLVALGVGVYLVASVATDSSIALGLHFVIISAWAAGLLVGAVVVVILSSLLAKVTLPLIVGASLAGIVLITALVVRTGRKA